MEFVDKEYEFYGVDDGGYVFICTNYDRLTEVDDIMFVINNLYRMGFDTDDIQFWKKDACIDIIVGKYVITLIY